VVVEIGTLHGGTLWAWCRLASEEANIVSIDLPGGAFGGGYGNEASDRLRSYARKSQQIHLMRADSHDLETLSLLQGILGGRSIDLLFIDADHTYNGVRRDFEMFSPMVSSSGVIAFHDVLPHDDPTCEVDRFWAEVSSVHEHVAFLEVRPDSERQWGGIGVLLHPSNAVE
jgi:predicted O-methyltransferase YrrM